MKLTGFWLLVALTASKFSPLAHGQILDVFHSFQGTDGATPYVGLLQGSDGNFYGATFHGGTNNYGTVFKLSSDGT